MSNNLGSNHGTKVVRSFAKAFESMLVLGKTVDTDTTKDGHDAATGETIYVKRPHQHKSIRTPGGDISSSTADEIIAGRIAVTKQDYITVYKNWSDVEQALELDQLDELMEGIAEEMCLELETSLGQFMIENAGLHYGTPGQAVNNWNEVSGAAALMKAIGVPMTNSYYVMNPFSQSNLANVQANLNGDDKMIRDAWRDSMLSPNVGGLRAMTSSSLKNYTAGAASDRAGTLAATPTATYVAAKDSMTMSLSLTGLSTSTTDAVRPGDIIEFTGTGANARSHVNIKTRETIMGASGTPVPFSCTVVTGGDTNGSGAVTVTVTAPAIYETAGGKGAYNNISAALASGDAFTIKGAADTVYQPNLFYNKGAFMVNTIQIPKLEAQDVTYKSKSGYVMRFSRGSSLLANTHQLRVDMVPAFGIAQPLMAGKGYGLS